MQDEHLDHALEGEFAGHGLTIHNLKISNAEFRTLLEQNHLIWREIHNIENGVTPASDDYLTVLRKQRLAMLDAIAQHIARAEA